MCGVVVMLKVDMLEVVSRCRYLDGSLYQRRLDRAFDSDRGVSIIWAEDAKS